MVEEKPLSASRSSSIETLDIPVSLWFNLQSCIQREGVCDAILLNHNFGWDSGEILQI